MGYTGGSTRAPEQWVLDRERRVLELRQKGRTFQQIADELEITGKGNAHNIFKRALARHVNDLAPEIKDLESSRYDRLQEAIWEGAMAGDLEAVDRVLRIMAQRAQLLGLNHSDKMQAKMAKIEADKVRIMAVALGRALDAIALSEAEKEQVQHIMFRELREHTGYEPSDIVEGELE